LYVTHKIASVDPFKKEEYKELKNCNASREEEKWPDNSIDLLNIKGIQLAHCAYPLRK
jgi:hypothetical protein